MYDGAYGYFGTALVNSLFRSQQNTTLLRHYTSATG